MFFGKEGCSRLDERSAHLHKRQKNEESGDKQKQCHINGPGLNIPVLKPPCTTAVEMFYLICSLFDGTA